MNYSENARLYVTGSKDGDVKVWDGISNRCIETFQRAHDGAQICSATFTRNGKVNFRTNFSYSSLLCFLLRLKITSWARNNFFSHSFFFHSVK